MKLEDMLAEAFKQEVHNELTKEIKIKEYLPQSAFDDARSRAKALLNKANKRTEDILTVAIANHRIKDHKEDFDIEKSTTERSMLIEDVNGLSRGRFWNH